MVKVTMNIDFGDNDETRALGFQLSGEETRDQVFRLCSALGNAAKDSIGIRWQDKPSWEVYRGAKAG